jgi:H+/Cl- antiporter ClcA
MKTPSWRKFLRGAGVKSDLTEIRTLFLRYLKEETLLPLKQLGRFVLFGAIGSVFVGFGLCMMLLGALRFLQDEFRVLDGSLSWLPYLIVVVLAAIVMALTMWRVVAGAAKRRLKTSE